MHTPQAFLMTLALTGGVIMSLASPFAVEVVRAHGPFGPAPYHDANAVLGPPATWFYNAFVSDGMTNRRVKLIEAAFNVAPDTNGLVTPSLIVTLDGGSEIIARFDQPIFDDPAHPYGIDLLVFGNALYSANGFVSDSANLNTLLLTGGGLFESTKVSVSPGYTGQPGEVADDPDTWPWYRYDNGPYADTAFPTHAYHWNRATTNWSDATMDFTKPVNPVLKTRLQTGGLTVADAIDLYVGSGGGTGFDLRESGFASVQYVKVEGVDPGFSEGEIDAFASVRPATVGDTLSLAPENILSNTATLFFQKPGAENENIATLSFTDVSDIVQVSTAPLTNLAGFAPLPGTPSTAVQLNLSPILGATPATFTADLMLATDTNYSGNGNDLLVLQSIGTNWSFLSFSYQTTNQQVHIIGVTNLSAFVVAHFTAPTLQLTANGNNYDIAFTPVPSLNHTLERSTNLIHWSALDTFTASNALPVVLTDDLAPADKAFYRLLLNHP